MWQSKRSLAKAKCFIARGYPGQQPLSILEPLKAKCCHPHATEAKFVGQVRLHAKAAGVHATNRPRPKALELLFRLRPRPTKVDAVDKEVEALAGLEKRGSRPKAKTPWPAAQIEVKDDGGQVVTTQLTKTGALPTVGHRG